MCQVVQTSEDALATRVLQAAIHALELYGIYLGKELGLYEALKFERRITPPELARTAGIAPRYAREWLEQQAVAGFLRVESTSAPAEARRYWLPAEHTNVFVADDHPAHLAPLAQMVAGIGGALPRVVNAYRSGGGVAYPHYGAAFRVGQAGVNRPAFLSELIERWLPAVPDVHGALMSSRTRVADVGSGAGWSTLAMAKAFPQAELVGFDADPASVHDAQRNAAAHGVAARFEVRDAGAIAAEGPFDLVLVLEALHDMSRPDEALRAIREALAPGGSVLIADEKVGDQFHAPGDDLERLMYGWSIVHCLPVAMAEQPSAAIGTVIRASTVQALATAAGFARVDVLPVDGGFFRLYRLRAE
jgi:2-polyprenyl-3-methyl-5-hydroxy-6-metoxy-1,4-benzoquinol methylase